MCIAFWRAQPPEQMAITFSDQTDSLDTLLSAHGLRRTAAARRVLGWLLAHPDTSYTHAQLQAVLVGEGDGG